MPEIPAERNPWRRMRFDAETNVVARESFRKAIKEEIVTEEKSDPSDPQQNVGCDDILSGVEIHQEVQVRKQDVVLVDAVDWEEPIIRTKVRCRYVPDVEFDFEVLVDQEPDANTENGIAHLVEAGKILKLRIQESTTDIRRDLHSIPMTGMALSFAMICLSISRD